MVDHDWAQSIYFRDPNGIQLEFCCFTRNLDAEDARMQDRAEISLRRLGLEPEGVGEGSRGAVDRALGEPVAPSRG